VTRERPILLVGSPRSGTTLVRDVLRAHPRLTFPPESNVLPALYRIYGDPADPRRARLLAGDLLRSYAIRSWGLELGVDDLARERTFAGMTAALYAAWAGREGKPRWGDKTPLHALELPAARAIFPGAQVVHLVRDGRAVAASLLRQPWGPSSATSAARLWRRCVEAAQRDGAALGADYHELRFERLVTAPEEELRTLCSFLGEEFDPAMLRPSRLPAAPGMAQPWPAAHEDAIDAAAAAGTALGARDRALVEAEAGPLLARLGYGPPGPSHRPGLVEQAAARAGDAAKQLRWRLTTHDRRARAETALRLARARVLVRSPR
jgi:hypothetical protein